MPEPQPDPLSLLSRALDQTEAVIRRVRPEQTGLPTPCSAFDVRALVNHIVYDVQLFTSMLAGAERGSPDADLIDDDWSGRYRAAADGLLAAWRQRGLEGTLTLPFGTVPVVWQTGQHITDLAVHAWDVARATGQSTDLDAEVGAFALDWGRQNLKPEYRGQAFGAEVAVPEEAGLYDRLAGFFGRQPGVSS